MRASCFSVVVALVFCELVSKVAVFCAQMNCQTVYLRESYQQFRVNKTGCFIVSSDTQQAFLLDTEYSTDFNLTFIDANNSTFWQLPNPAIDKVPFNVMILAPGEGNVTVHYSPVKQLRDNSATFRIREAFGGQASTPMRIVQEDLKLGVGQRKVVYSPNYRSNRLHITYYLKLIYNVRPATQNSVLQYTIVKAGLAAANTFVIMDANRNTILWSSRYISNVFMPKGRDGYPSLVFDLTVMQPDASASFAISLVCPEPPATTKPSTTTRQPYISTQTSTYNSNYNRNNPTVSDSSTNKNLYFLFLLLILPLLYLICWCRQLECSNSGSSRRQTGYVAAPVDSSYPVAHGGSVQVYQGAHPPSQNTIEMQPTAPGSNSWPYSTSSSAPPQQSSARADEPPSYWEAVNAPKPS